MESYNYQKYLFHKKLFKIKDSIYLKEFEKLLKKSKDSDIECSCKISSGKIEPIRFNVYYDYKERNEKINYKRHIRSINLIFYFFKKIDKLPKVTMNYDLIKKIFNDDFNLKKLQRVVMGIDFRVPLNDSRVKIWFLLKDGYPKKIKEILELHGYTKEMKDIAKETQFGFGFDFSFEGRTCVKIYLLCDKQILKKIQTWEKMKNIFSEKEMELIKQSNFLIIGFKGDGERQLTIRPKDFSSIIKESNNKILMKVLNKLENKDFNEYGTSITLAESEIKKGSIENVNLYY